MRPLRARVRLMRVWAAWFVWPLLAVSVAGACQTRESETPPPPEPLWTANLSKTPIGFQPIRGSPIPGFEYGTWDFVAGGRVDVQHTTDGRTKAFRAYMPSGAPGTGKQRAELTPRYDPGGEGTTFWFGFDLAVPVWSTPTSWGPLVMQLKRDGLGNGPASINLHNGRMVIEGASGVPSQGSTIDLGPIPAPGTRTRVVVGFYLHTTKGWVEGWRDGVSKGRVEPWVSKDTSYDGPGVWGSTLAGGTGVYLKIGGYRGGGQGPLDLRYSELRAATTRAGVM
jgi:Polysaccharide lyase